MYTSFDEIFYKTLLHLALKLEMSYFILVIKHDAKKILIDKENIFLVNWNVTIIYSVAIESWNQINTYSIKKDICDSLNLNWKYK